LRPGRDGARRDLVKRCEAAEGHGAGCKIWRISYVRHGVSYIECQITAGHTEYLLAVEGLFSGWDNLVVANQIVVTRHAGGREHIEPAYDHGGRAQHEQRKPSELAIAIEIDQHVDGVLFDETGGGLVPESGNIVITGAVCFGDGGFGGVGEEMNLKARAIVVREQRPDRLHPVLPMEER
jgi:hypothetical protein